MSELQPPETRSAAEWELLVECCCAEPRAEKLNGLTNRVEWDGLLDFAEDQGVTGQVATELGKLAGERVAGEVKKKLLERHRSQLFSGLRMTGELFRLVERFAKENIGLLAVKGPALAVQAYGDPGMRSYGDLDLLVRQKDIYRATEIMIADGFAAAIPLDAIRAEKTPGQYMFGQRESKLLVELHNENTLRYFPKKLPLEHLFERRRNVPIDGREVPALCTEDMLVLICVHGAKHFWDRLMWIADVSALVTRQKDMDWKLVNYAAQAAGAERMVNTGLRLAVELLRAELPADVWARVERDRVAGLLATETMRSLRNPEQHSPGLWQRALFRMRMRGGGFLGGAGYLVRILFSPTEEDWAAETGGQGNAFSGMARRPWRLARKYAKKNKD